MLIDSHAHLEMIAAAPGFSAAHPEAGDSVEERIALLLRLLSENNMEHLIHISTDYPAHFTVEPYRRKNRELLSCALGFLPEKKRKKIPDREKINKIIEKSQICAIGEIGMDFSRDNGSAVEQRELFEEQLGLAADCRLPVIVHSRDAARETLQVLRRYPQVGGVIHCFTYGEEFALEAWKLGYAISFSGILTYPNRTAEIRRAAAVLPDEALLVETDAPFLAPQKKRGKLNFPWYAAETAQLLAGLRGCPVERIIEVTAANCRRIFRIGG